MNVYNGLSRLGAIDLQIHTVYFDQLQIKSQSDRRRSHNRKKMTRKRQQINFGEQSQTLDRLQKIEKSDLH